jgi:hypothetical protein
MTVAMSLISVLLSGLPPVVWVGVGVGHSDGGGGRAAPGCRPRQQQPRRVCRRRDQRTTLPAQLRCRPAAAVSTASTAAHTTTRARSPAGGLGEPPKMLVMRRMNVDLPQPVGQANGSTLQVRATRCELR